MADFKHNKGFGKKGFKKSGNRNSGGLKKSGGSGSGGFRRKDSDGFNRRDSEGSSGMSKRTETHEATCAQCGQSCTVPFKPSGGKPVYCRDCFRGQTKPSTQHKSSSLSNSISEINKKLDKIMEALELE